MQCNLWLHGYSVLGLTVIFKTETFAEKVKAANAVSFPFKNSNMSNSFLFCFKDRLYGQVGHMVQWCGTRPQVAAVETPSRCFHASLPILRDQ